MPPRPPVDDGQQPTARAGRVGQKADPKILGIPRNYALAGGAVFVLALIWFVWHRKQAAAPAITPTTSTATATTTPPYSGIPPWLLAGLSTSTATGTGTGGTGTGGGGTGGGGTGTTTKTSTPTQVNQYKMPTGLTVTPVNNTTIRVQWSLAGQPTPRPASYTIGVYQLNGKTVAEQTVSVPDQANGTSGATISGLHHGWSYNVHVWANGGKIAPPHASKEIKV